MKLQNLFGSESTLRDIRPVVSDEAVTFCQVLEKKLSILSKVSPQTEEVHLKDLELFKTAKAIETAKRRKT
ncbi:hypothetical protein PsorP6_000412 [Peronosclerospora sorghi]|uniref:Uncharacterized protein n=1 Tax=Peronosclerospora sorghi TaxID=230839 RepID=A0ACC0WQM1_9STRA|nr:hypothetical protein PsorP6_000412 [Peronosclerospora sorghi]